MIFKKFFRACTFNFNLPDFDSNIYFDVIFSELMTPNTMPILDLVDKNSLHSLTLQSFPCSVRLFRHFNRRVVKLETKG